MEHYRSWKSIGLELGIDSAALDAIEKNYANDHRRLIAMIELWHVSVDLKPSHEAMVKALQSNRVTTSIIGMEEGGRGGKGGRGEGGGEVCSLLDK